MTRQELEEKIQKIKEDGANIKVYKYINGVRQEKFTYKNVKLEDIHLQKYGDTLGLIWRYEGRRIGCQAKMYCLYILLDHFYYWFENELN